MRKWRFEFYDYDLQQATPLKYDVDEWKSFGVSYGREEKTSIVKSYSAQFTFINEDALFLRDIVKSRGFSARIGLNVYIDDLNDLYYQCRLELYECKIFGNTFQCPVYTGGFFALLDNEWSVKRTISNRIEVPKHVEGNVVYNGISYPDNDFENIRFIGGKYKYEKLLNVNADRLELSKAYGMSGTFVAGEENQLRNKANFLPIVNEGDDKRLRFFSDSVNAVVLDNQAEVTTKQMFVLSQSRINAGTIEVNGSIGRLECLSNSNAFDWSGGTEYECKARIVFYLCLYDNFSTSENDKWRPSEHSLLANGNVGYADVSAVEIPLTATCIINDEGNNALVFFQNGGHYPSTADTEVHFSNISFDVSWLKNYVSGHGGYYMGLCATINFYYKDNGMWVNVGNGAEVISYRNAFNVNMKYVDFMVNPYRRLFSGIRPSVLFRKMVEKINGKATPKYDNDGNSLGNYNGDYKLNIDLSELENADSGIMLFSDTMAKGSLSDKSAGMETSLEDLCRFIYVNFGLKMCCLYDRANDAYNISFKQMSDLYDNSEMLAIDNNTTRVEINANAEVVYSHVKVGYNNIEEAILGLKEYNTLNTFKTEHKERPELSLDLFGVYKGGCFDVETIAHTMQYDDDTNVNSDNILVLEVNRIGDRIITSKNYNVNYKDVSVGLNCGITPKRLLLLHMNELVAINDLSFETSHRNADFEFLGVAENKNETTAGVVMLYAPFTMSVKGAGLIDVISKMDANPFGYVRIKIGGATYVGYLANDTECVSVNPMNEQATEFYLLVKFIPF